MSSSGIFNKHTVAYTPCNYKQLQLLLLANLHAALATLHDGTAFNGRLTCQPEDPLVDPPAYQITLVREPRNKDVIGTDAYGGSVQEVFRILIDSFDPFPLHRLNLCPLKAASNERTFNALQVLGNTGRRLLQTAALLHLSVDAVADSLADIQTAHATDRAAQELCAKQGPVGVLVSLTTVNPRTSFLETPGTDTIRTLPIRTLVDYNRGHRLKISESTGVGSIHNRPRYSLDKIDHNSTVTNGLSTTENELGIKDDSWDLSEDWAALCQDHEQKHGLKFDADSCDESITTADGNLLPGFETEFDPDLARASAHEQRKARSAQLLAERTAARAAEQARAAEALRAAEQALKDTAAENEALAAKLERIRLADIEKNAALTAEKLRVEQLVLDQRSAQSAATRLHFHINGHKVKAAEKSLEALCPSRVGLDAAVKAENKRVIPARIARFHDQSPAKRLCNSASALDSEGNSCASAIAVDDKEVAALASLAVPKPGPPPEETVVGLPLANTYDQYPTVTSFYWIANSTVQTCIESTQCGIGQYHNVISPVPNAYGVTVHLKTPTPLSTVRKPGCSISRSVPVNYAETCDDIDRYAQQFLENVTGGVKLGKPGQKASTGKRNTGKTLLVNSTKLLESGETTDDPDIRAANQRAVAHAWTSLIVAVIAKADPILARHNYFA